MKPAEVTRESIFAWDVRMAEMQDSTLAGSETSA